MNNPQLEKVLLNIEKTKAKISEYQTKLRELEREKTKLENEQIVAIIRGEKISDAQLSALVESFRDKQTTSAPAGFKTPAEKIIQEDKNNAKTEKD